MKILIFSLIAIVVVCSVVLFSPLVVFAEEQLLTNTILSTKQIPTWIKNTSDWWSKDQISDKEFLNAIQFLTDSNIIHISENNESNPPKVSSFLENPLENNQPTLTNEIIDNHPTWYSSVSEAISNPQQSNIIFPKISGHLDINSSKIPVIITIEKPDGETQIIKTLTNRGKYSSPIASTSNDVPGIYKIEIKVDQDIIKTSYSFLDGTTKEIPTWIKHNAGWWSNGDISDDDFLQGIQFLVKNKMISPKKSIITNFVSENYLADYLDPKSILDPKSYSESLTKIGNESRQECRDRVIKSGLGNAEISKCNRLPSNYKEHVSAVFDLTDPATQERLGRGEFKKISRGMADLYPNKSGYDYSNHDYSPYYSSNYGYTDADVQRYLDRADYYANQWLNDIEPYAQKWANGQMSYNEYERLGMQSFDYYSDQFVNEYMGNYP